ncbi:hypothetical protein J4E08_10995 [Sagittula sp. NFXS13]|uniref:hypothetical protein n=1 Tax=Sagittula sp. NFXS13 TaxID=2819095 RepID=UPI0032DF85A6
MTRQTMSQVLLRDLVTPADLTPILGKTTRPDVLLEHLIEERTTVGLQLQRIEGLMACLAGDLEEYAGGRMSKDVLISEMSRTVHVMAMEMFYDETQALAAE